MCLMMKRQGQEVMTVEALGVGSGTLQFIYNPGTAFAKGLFAPGPRVEYQELLPLCGRKPEPQL